jgi:protein-S-isoprenylcysteine O-methyltransferase Ste14
MTALLYAVIVAACLSLFAIVNLDNILRFHRIRSATSAEPEIEKRIAVPLLLAGTGTIAFFLESFLYLLLAFSEGFRLPAFLDFGANWVNVLAVFGSLVMVFGYGIFIWSVVARGQYATSWQMPTDQKLVDWGPYRYARHPSYLGYFLMFIGFLLMWQNALALIPLIAIPGYARITNREEEMLVATFGTKYREYRKHVGRFLPRISVRKQTRLLE